MSQISQDLLNDCELEPLAFSGLIQSHGALLFIARESNAITYGSENLEDFVGESYEDLIGSSGTEWVEEMLPDLTNLPTGAGNRVYLPRAIDLGEGEINVLISPTGNGWLIEFERAGGESELVSTPKIPHLENPADEDEMAAIQQALVDGIAAVTDYDRVMLYQFLPDWSGEVLAESVLRSSGTYLSLRFPASDIPAIARGLYAQMPYRYIPHATNETVNVVGSSQQGNVLDLTWSDLRSVSPVHIQYLMNMNVHASFSVSIMVDGKLWGLIASHNDREGVISLPARLACTELVRHFVDRIDAQRIAQQKLISETLREQIKPALAGGGTSSALAQAIVGTVGQLSSQIYFTDCLVDVAGYVSTIGDSLPQDVIQNLVALSANSAYEDVDIYESLPDSFDVTETAHAHGVFGCASIRFRAKNLGNVLINVTLIRNEEAKDVAWAGNPQKPVEMNSGGAIKLSPRESFEKWVQVRSGMCRTWNEDDLFTLGLLRNKLVEVLS